MPSIARYDPFDLLEGMMKSVLRPRYEAAVTQQRQSLDGTIPIDVAENDKAYLLWADLPGVRKEDISVAIAGTQVTLTAEAKEEKAVDQGQGQDAFLVRERRTGTLFRELQFAAEIDDAKAQAEFRDGVLRITLWKKESSQVKRLSIH